MPPRFALTLRPSALTAPRLVSRKDCPPSAFLIPTSGGSSSVERSLCSLLLAHGVRLRPRTFLTVCVKCNGRIDEVTSDADRQEAYKCKVAPASALPLFKCDGGNCGQYYWWNEKAASSAGRAKSMCEGLFRRCVREGVEYDGEDMGMFAGVELEPPKEGVGRGRGDERPPVDEWLTDAALKNDLGAFTR